jgi:hypothetical protein
MLILEIQNQMNIAKAQNDYGASFRLLVEGLRESKIGAINIQMLTQLCV